ncbi:MAG: hypothetical protein IBX55_23630 [Methyloprofundus sp.]|nr:hypothetical protein [Methyloprofundus sp.]
MFAYNTHINQGEAPMKNYAELSFDEKKEIAQSDLNDLPNAEVIAKFIVNHESFAIREILASNSSLHLLKNGMEIAANLASDDIESVRCALAAVITNFRYFVGYEEVVKKLANDQDVKVRCALAGNLIARSKFDCAIAVNLTNDSSSEVVAAVEANESCNGLVGLGFFLVTLNIQMGEYEKSCVKLIIEEDEAKAGQAAMEGECHGSIEDGTSEETKDGIADLGWTFHYSVRNCVKVCNEDAVTMAMYL